jgi:hypothetical protein
MFDPLAVFLSNPERRWMMLIIEIHVDTIEESKPSTRKKREDERLNKASDKSKNTGNRFWNAIKLSIPGSLIPQDKNER